MDGNRSACYCIDMGKHEKLYEHILMRQSDANVPFDGLCALLTRLGFDDRTRGGHHLFTMTGVAEIVNLQPRNGKGKSYHVKQVRDMILKYNLKGASGFVGGKLYGSGRDRDGLTSRVSGIVRA